MVVEILSPLKEGFFYDLKTLSFEKKKKDLPILPESKAVILKEQEIAAYCLYRVLPEGIAEIDYIETQKSFRRKKLGSRLLKELIRSESVKKLWLEVSSDNHDAISFYESHGFIKEGLRKNYYKNGEDAFLYSLNLQNH